jgi:hypothetical protein
VKIPGLCAKDRDFVRRILRTWKEDDGNQIGGSAYTYSGYRWAWLNRRASPSSLRARSSTTCR